MIKALNLKPAPRIGDSCYENSRIIVDPKEKGFELIYNDVGWRSPAQFQINFGFGRLIIKCKRISLFKTNRNDYELEYTGVYTHLKSIIFNWRGKHKYFNMPFSFVNGKQYLYCKDGTWVKSDKIDYPERQRLQFEKTCFFDNGGNESVNATVSMRRWVYSMAWFPFVKKTIQDIDIEFHEEVGSEKGSWKGGVVGTSFQMLKDETMDQAYHRFFTTRRF